MRFLTALLNWSPRSNSFLNIPKLAAAGESRIVSFSTITYEALAVVVSGDFTPEKAMDFVITIEVLQRELGDKVSVK